MRHTLTLQACHEKELRELVLSDDGHESVAYLLCRRADIGHDPWTGVPETRLISREVVAVAEVDIFERSVDRVTWRSSTLHELLPRCQVEGLVMVLVHSHPAGNPNPSAQDDANESQLFEYGWIRDGDDLPFGSIVITQSTIRGRVWYGWSPKAFPLELVRCIGNRFEFHAQHRSERHTAAFARQIIAFGAALESELSTLRVAVVGAGGTGSATATLLARLGVGYLTIIDPDLVETSNLNRVHGARQADVDAGRTKVDVLKTMISEIGIGVSIRVFALYVDDYICRDVLRSCDVIFACTDDNAGRLFLNRLAYHYVIPVIDMGLVITIDDIHATTPRLQDLIGRVTVLAPGTTCIACRNVTDANLAAEELTRRTRPGEYARLKAEGYVLGEGNPRPAIVTFTTEVAAMAINELLQRMTNFRGFSRDQRIRNFIDEEDLSLAPQSRKGCKFCDTELYNGYADTPSFIMPQI